MNFLLIIVAFSGNVYQHYYNTAEECETALFVKTDEGRYKYYDEAHCINLTIPENAYLKYKQTPTK
jgi:hypothetical protein